MTSWRCDWNKQRRGVSAVFLFRAFHISSVYQVAIVQLLAPSGKLKINFPITQLSSLILELRFVAISIMVEVKYWSMQRFVSIYRSKNNLMRISLNDLGSAVQAVPAIKRMKIIGNWIQTFNGCTRRRGQRISRSIWIVILQWRLVPRAFRFDWRKTRKRPIFERMTTVAKQKKISKTENE